MENYPTVISYYRREVYGVRMDYIAAYESEAMQKLSDSVRALTGRKTLTASDVAALIQLGFRFKEVFPPN